MKKLFIMSTIAALFSGSALAVPPSIYDPDSFLNYVSPPANAGAFETNYLNEIVTAAYGLPSSGSSRMSLKQWKIKNGMLSANGTSPGPLTVTSVKYYNSADLGLGRDMNCVDQSNFETSLPGAQGRGAKAIACYVSNHGAIGGGAQRAFDSLSGGGSPFATVAMEFRPGQAKNKVRFFVFGNGDDEANQFLVNLNGAPGIFLDSGNGRTQPAVCMNCHGGQFTDTNADGVMDNVANAHFLPFDFSTLEFPSAEARKNAIAPINKLNEMIRNAEWQTYSADTTHNRIALYLNAEYGATTTSSFPVNTPMSDTYIEPNFAAAADQDLYKSVVRNTCRTCHLAVPVALTPSTVVSKICNTGSGMPQAEVNTKNLLRHADEIARVMDKRGIATCYNLPVLSDFIGEATAAKGLTTTPSLIHVTTSSFQFTDNKSKRVLSLLPTSESNFSGSVVVEASKVGATYIRSIKTIEFVGSVLKTDNSTRIFVNSYDINGNLLASASTDTSLAGSAVVVTSIPGSPFKKYSLTLPASVYKAEILLDRKFINSSFDFDPWGAPLEISDLSVTYNQPVNLTQNKFAVEDFEDKATLSTSAPLGDLRMSIGNAITNTNAACAAARTSSGQTAGTQIGNAIKVERDAGRFSLHSNPIFCSGELTTFTIVPRTSAVNGRNLSFDFVIDKDSLGFAPVGALYLNGFSRQNILEMARQQGTVTESSSKIFGHVRILVSTNLSIPFAWRQYNTDSGVDSNNTSIAQPVKGFAIDNITMWDQ